MQARRVLIVTRCLSLMLLLFLAMPASAQQAPQSEPPRLVAQLGHKPVNMVSSTGVTAVAFSPDDQYVATGGDDEMVRVWEAETGREVQRFEGLGERVRSVAFSPGGRYVMAEGDGTAGVWEVATAREVRPFEEFSGKRLEGISPGGRYVVTSGGRHMDDTEVQVWDVSTGQMHQIRANWHGGFGDLVALSPDGQYVAMEEDYAVVRLWDVATGAPGVRFIGHTGDVLSIAFSSDSRYLLTASRDSTARLWEVDSGKVRHRFEGHTGEVISVAISSDNQHVVTASYDGTTWVWDADTGRERYRLEGALSTSQVAFSPDGRYVVTDTQVWDVQTGREVRSLAHPFYSFYALSSDDRHIVTVHRDEGVRLLEVETDEEVQRFEGQAGAVTSVAFSPDGQYALTGGGAAAKLWDLTTGKQVRRFTGHERGGVASVAFSPDSRRVLTGADGSVRLWDTETGTQEYLFEKGAFHIIPPSVAFSPDGRYVLAGASYHVVAWETENGTEILQDYGRWPTLNGDLMQIYSIAVSPDSLSPLYLLIGEGDSREGASLWTADMEWTWSEDDDLEGVQQVARLPHAETVIAVAFSPDGRYMATGGDKVRLWSVETREEVHTLEGHQGVVSSIAFSPDSKLMVTGSGDQTARLWEVETGGEIHRFDGHQSIVTSVAFAPDGRHILTGSLDGSARLWDVDTGRAIAQLFSFRDGSWAVVDLLGRYDASDGGDIPGLHWVAQTPAGLQSIALTQFKDLYYEPGLIGKHLGYNKEGLRDVGTIKRYGLDLYPDVHLTDTGGGRYAVTLTNWGGGIGRVVVSVNGREVQADARDTLKTNLEADSLTLPLDVPESRFLLADSTNTIAVKAYNAEGSLVSRSDVLRFRPRRGVAGEPRLWAVIAGVSDYRGTRLDLSFAAKDAEDFYKALQVGAERLFGVDSTRITLLSDTSDTPATRDNLINALEALADPDSGAVATDILVVYLAGHGVLHGDDFYYLTQEAQTGNLTTQALRETTALSSKELTDLIKQVPALKQVLILDTCHAGKAFESLSEGRDAIGSSKERSLERMKDRMGLYVLAGSAADAVSYEASRYGQGLLTYSLLMGMRGAALREGSLWDVSGLFNYAVDQVPKLAEGIDGIQHPLSLGTRVRRTDSTSAAPRSFEIGAVTPEDQAQIPLALEKPVVLRSSFVEEGRAHDRRLRLGPMMDEALRAQLHRSPNAPVVFVEADGFPEAYQVSGIYRVNGDEVTVQVSLSRGEGEAVEDIALRPFTRPRAELKALVSAILEAAVQRLVQAPSESDL